MRKISGVQKFALVSSELQKLSKSSSGDTSGELAEQNDSARSLTLRRQTSRLKKNNKSCKLLLIGEELALQNSNECKHN